ncbi:MAG: 2-oxoacid:acceptor oxidoreductase family protein [Acidimicrobiales bacterium]
MEREIVLTGIGGQGVQLAAQVLAQAAVDEGRGVMLFGVYGGMMRGGNSDSTVVVAEGSVQSPPVISRAWSAIALHHKYWEPLVPKLVPGSVVLVNSSLFEGELDREAWRVFDVPVTDLAAGLGHPMTASMVMVGAFAAITGLVGLDAAVAGMAASVPPYRRQHVDANAEAIRAGWDAAADLRLAAPAWEPAGATA